LKNDIVHDLFNSIVLIFIKFNMITNVKEKKNRSDVF